MTRASQIFVSPCVLLLYPVWILPVTLGLGVYGGISQVSWYCHTWRKELTDPEKGTETPFMHCITFIPRCILQTGPKYCLIGPKYFLTKPKYFSTELKYLSGFFGWLCNKLSIPDCSPYQVVILTSLGDADPSTLTSVI